MKAKPQPHNTKSGNYLEQALMKGLSERGKAFAREEIKKAESFGIAIPWGLIRKAALDIK